MGGAVGQRLNSRALVLLKKGQHFIDEPPTTLIGSNRTLGDHFAFFREHDFEWQSLAVGLDNLRTRLRHAHLQATARAIIRPLTPLVLLMKSWTACLQSTDECPERVESQT